MKKIIIVSLLLALALPISAWQSALVSMHGHQLQYHPDADGAVLPDFSHAGYRGADAQIPKIPVVRTISPITGDNTAHVQAAIDAVGKMPLVDGVRGALLLSQGVYEIQGTLQIPYDGVVLRGENAILRATGDTPHQRDVLVVGANKRIWGATEKNATRQYISDAVLPVGTTKITVPNPHQYEVGQQIIIYHPCSNQWLKAVDYGGVPYPDPSAPSDKDERWTENQYPIVYHRYITAIENGKIHLDAPLFYALKKSVAQSYIYVPDMKGTIYGSGIENITIEIESQGGEDENHAWNAVRFRSIENAWAIDCAFSGFGQAGIVTEACRRSSFIRCDAVDPVGITSGERKYNFNTYLYSQLNLFSHCYARAGRHHFMSNGVSGTSGNVFLYCISDGALSVNEGHRGWTQGMLYDNHRDVNMTRPFTLGLYNRVAMGTGHGWAAVNSVLWNCDVDKSYGTIGLQKPPTAQNYAIGCKAKKITGRPVSASDFTLGYVEGQNKEGLEPTSLYLAQLQARNQSLAIQHTHTVSKPLLSAHNGLLTVLSDMSDMVLYSADGKKVYSASHLQQNQVISTSWATNGMYFAYLYIDNQLYIQKIVL